ncbi:MAG: polysaccharide pyruvyl transferase family protein [Alistipes sp.]|nr:polysaccharide pyruvyl transferase family protein [Alistipes sp.]
MKIGIITHWNSKDNYGQVLQCYALQRYLISLGHEPFLIRYAPTDPPRNLSYKILHFWEIINISHIRAYIQYRTNKRKLRHYYIANNPDVRKFDEFRNDFIVMSDKIYRSFEELYAENWDADAMISGSDQVWNCPEYTRRSYFLDFASDRITKIAYAASFGKALLDEQYEKALPRLLRHFKAVGLRETSGVELCRKAGREDAQLVCDPTLLLNGLDYIDDILKTDIETANHIFCYFINWNTSIPTDRLSAYAADNGLSIRYFNAHGLDLNDFAPTYDDMTVQSWIESLASAECVCTNSFHGTVFSILMHKPFIALPLQGDVKAMNVRLATLLNKLGLEERLYDSTEDFSQQMKAPIDWNAIDEKLNAFKSESEDFLQKALP